MKCEVCGKVIKIDWTLPSIGYLPHSQIRIASLRRILRGRPVAILASGPSIRELEERKEELRNLGICYFGFNKFTQEKYILEPIGKHLFLFMVSDRNVVPLVIDDVGKFLNRDEDNVFLSSFWGDTFGKTDLDIPWFLKTYDNRLLFFNLDYSHDDDTVPNLTKPLHFTVGNSLQVLIQIAIICKAPSIILFGADGGYKKGDAECYYRQDEYWGQKGLNDWLHHDLEFFNAEMPISIKNTLATYNLKMPDILNCSPDSRYEVFRKVNYNEVFEYLNGR